MKVVWRIAKQYCDFWRHATQLRKMRDAFRSGQCEGRSITRFIWAHRMGASWRWLIRAMGPLHSSNPLAFSQEASLLSTSWLPVIRFLKMCIIIPAEANPLHLLLTVYLNCVQETEEAAYIIGRKMNGTKRTKHYFWTCAGNMSSIINFGWKTQGRFLSKNSRRGFTSKL